MSGGPVSQATRAVSYKRVASKKSLRSTVAYFADCVCVVVYRTINKFMFEEAPTFLCELTHAYFPTVRAGTATVWPREKAEPLQWRPTWGELPAGSYFSRNI